MVKDGILTIKGTSGEPFLGFAPGILAAESKLRFRLRCAGGSGKVAWLPNPNTKPADAPKSVEFMVKAGEWAEISVAIPAPGGKPGIVRLYLPAQDSTVEIDWLEIGPSSKAKPIRTEF